MRVILWVPCAFSLIFGLGIEAAERNAQPENGVLTLFFVDENNKPVDEVDLCVARDLVEKARPRISFSADPNRQILRSGRFIPLASGSYSIAVQPTFLRPYVGEVRITIKSREASTATVQVYRLPIEDLTVMVASEAGEPVARIAVWAAHDEYQTFSSSSQTDENGKAVVKVIAGTKANLKVKPPGHLPYQPLVLEWPADGQENENEVKVVLTEKKLKALCSARLREDGEEYAFEEHKPSRDVYGPPRLLIRPQEKKAARPQNAYMANGRFELRGLAPGRYVITGLEYPRQDMNRIYVCPPVEEYVFQIAADAAAPQELPAAVFWRWDQRPAELQIAVKNAAPADMVRLSVAAQRLNRAGNPAGGVAPARLREDGVYVFEALPAGIYNVEVRSGRKRIGLSEKVVVEFARGQLLTVDCGRGSAGVE